jgi:hypothetical protein
LRGASGRRYQNPTSSGRVENPDSQRITRFPVHVNWADIRFLSFDTRTVVVFEKEKRELFEFETQAEMTGALEELSAREAGANKSMSRD